MDEENSVSDEENNIFEVERILNKKIKNNQAYYLIKWFGYGK